MDQNWSKWCKRSQMESKWVEMNQKEWNLAKRSQMESNWVKRSKMESKWVKIIQTWLSLEFPEFWPLFSWLFRGWSSLRSRLDPRPWRPFDCSGIGRCSNVWGRLTFAGTGTSKALFRRHRCIIFVVPEKFRKITKNLVKISCFDSICLYGPMETLLFFICHVFPSSKYYSERLLITSRK